MATEAVNDPEFNSEETQTSSRCSPDGLMGNAIKNNLLKKTVQSPASAENVVVVYDKSSDTAAPISTTKHGETSGAPSTTNDTPAESKTADPTEFAVETTAGSVNSETEEANEEPGKVIEDDEDKVDEPNTSENSAGSEGEFYSGQSEKDDDNEEAAMLGSNPEIEQEGEPESEPEIEPDVESETEAEAEGVSEKYQERIF